jgi:hypothetical protein
MLDLKPALFEQLNQRQVGKRYVMIVEVPIARSGIANVRAKCDQATARSQTVKRVQNSSFQYPFIRKMFKEVARENGVQSTQLKVPWQGAILQKKFDFRVGVAFCGGVEVHGVLPPCRYLVDELTVSAAQVEH